MVLDERTPVICPSPFIESKPPVWTPDYELPGFLYSHLEIYPIPGRPYLFPKEFSAEGAQHAEQLTRETLTGAGRFLIYGRVVWVRPWREWFASREEFSGWTQRSLGPFGDVDVVEFERRAEAVSGAQ